MPLLISSIAIFSISCFSKSDLLYNSNKSVPKSGLFKSSPFLVIKKTFKLFDIWSKTLLFILKSVSDEFDPLCNGIWIPIGKLSLKENEQSTKINVEFFSDFSQLKYVFAEVLTKSEIQKTNEIKAENEINRPIDAKIKILEDEKDIIEVSNVKFKEENENLKIEVNELNNKILSLNNEILKQKEAINQFNIDRDELDFLRLNLIYSHKCQTRKLFSTGFKVGTPEYRNCILRKGRKN